MANDYMRWAKQRVKNDPFFQAHTDPRFFDGIMCLYCDVRRENGHIEHTLTCPKRKEHGLRF